MIWWGVLLLFFPTLCLQVGNFWGFEVVSAVLFLSFGVSYLLAWLGQPFFICHQHLWFALLFFATGICVQSLPFTAFSAVGIRIRLFVFALLALVSGHQCISQFLVSCCALAAHQLHPWRFELEFFPSVTLWTALQIPLWSKPHLVFHHKVYEIALSEVPTTQMGMTEVQHQNQLIWVVQIWPNFDSQRVDSMGSCS